MLILRDLADLLRSKTPHGRNAQRRFIVDLLKAWVIGIMLGILAAFFDSGGTATLPTITPWILLQTAFIAILGLVLSGTTERED